LPQEEEYLLDVTPWLVDI